MELVELIVKDKSKPVKNSDFRVKGVRRIRELGKRSNISGFRGYPGLVATAQRISEYIPKCKTYVEPFAGLGRLTRFIKADRIILNEKSEYAFNYLSKHFNAKITNLDFEECIKLFDGPDTFFLIDPPWAKDAYEDNPKSYCNMEPSKYYEKILELLQNSNSHWIVCCEKTKNLKGYENYNNMIVEASRVKRICNGVPKTKLYSNKPFIRYHQEVLI